MDGLVTRHVRPCPEIGVLGISIVLEQCAGWKRVSLYTATSKFTCVQWRGRWGTEIHDIEQLNAHLRALTIHKLSQSNEIRKSILVSETNVYQISTVRSELRAISNRTLKTIPSRSLMTRQYTTPAVRRLENCKSWREWSSRVQPISCNESSQTLLSSYNQDGRESRHRGDKQSLQS